MSADSRVWTIPSWCDDSKLSRGWWYTQPAELLPKHVKSGRAVRIFESPREYFERLSRIKSEQREAA